MTCPTPNCSSSVAVVKIATNRKHLYFEMSSTYHGGVDLHFKKFIVVSDICLDFWAQPSLRSPKFVYVKCCNKWFANCLKNWIYGPQIGWPRARTKGFLIGLGKGMYCISKILYFGV